MSDRICSVDGCNSQHEARGYCNKHYLRWRRLGSVDDPPSMEDRFWARLEKTDSCWVWPKSSASHGYGEIWDGERNVLAHRFAYELLVGPIPAGMQVDHVCRNRLCVNPAHLRVVTNKQNSEHHNGSAKRNNVSSGVRGVSWDKRRQWWTVNVMHQRRNHYGGSYRNLSEAEAAVVALRNRLHTHNDLDRVA